MEKNNQQNGLMSWKQFIQLAKTHDLNCISIYVPTSRAGEKVDQRHAQLILKNLLREINAKLEESVKVKKELKESLQKLEQLLENDHFFRHQSDGLAIYIRGSDMFHFTLPVHFEAGFYISDHFYLIPVLPFFNDDGTYYLMALSQNNATLYEGSRHFFTEIILDEMAPESLEDRVGPNFQEKSLQFRSTGGANEGVLYHGHGSGNDARQKELEKYFKSLDQAINTLLHDKNAPLLLACVNPHFSMYRDLTAYNFLFPDYIPGNPDEVDAQLLHEKSWQLMAAYFLEERRKFREGIRDLSAGGRTSYSLEEIIPAAVDGRIEALFLQRGMDVYGVYNQDKRTVERMQYEMEYNRASLFNMTATNTLIKGGRVFLESQEKMPFVETEINALFRY